MARTALVTGANRGIGAAIARQLAGRGIDVIAGVRDVASAEGLLADIARSGRQGDAIGLDVGNLRSIRSCVAALKRKGRVIDILVNNAGILTGEKLLEMDGAEVLEAIRVNALGPLALMRTLGPAMAARRYGRIVNVSSQWGALAHLGPGAYGVSKSLLNAITVKVAGELPDCVKVNAMCPGWVKTRMGGEGAPLSPEQGADTAVWLATLAGNGPTGGYFRNRKRLSWLD